jgi:hypothetical protein
MGKKINMESKITANDNVIWREVDEEAVILNIDTNNYYTLNKIGTEIWKNIKSNNKLGDIVKKVMNRYEVNEKRLLKDIEKLAAALQNEDLIKII